MRSIVIHHCKQINSNIEVLSLPESKLTYRNILIRPDWHIAWVGDELISHEEQHDLLKLQGKIHWEGDLDSSREGR